MRNGICRLIVSLDCNRTCSYCCNKQPLIKEAMKPVTLNQIAGQYAIYALTGGEPLMPENVDLTYRVAEELRKYLNNNTHMPPKIYLYTATVSEWIPDLLSNGLIDGLTFSLHNPLRHNDKEQFYRLQELITFFPDESFYLNIDQGCSGGLVIKPSLWDRIQTFKPLAACPVPPGEDLCILTQEV